MQSYTFNNAYIYVKNNPITKADSNGDWTEIEYSVDLITLLFTDAGMEIPEGYDEVTISESEDFDSSIMKQVIYRKDVLGDDNEGTMTTEIYQFKYENYLTDAEIYYKKIDFVDSWVEAIGVTVQLNPNPIAMLISSVTDVVSIVITALKEVGLSTNMLKEETTVNYRWTLTSGTRITNKYTLYNGLKYPSRKYELENLKK